MAAPPPAPRRWALGSPHAGSFCSEVLFDLLSLENARINTGGLALLFAGVLSQLLRQSALDERATAPQFLLVLLVVISVIAMGAWQSQLPDYVKWRPAAAQWDTDLPP